MIGQQKEEFRTKDSQAKLKRPAARKAISSKTTILIRNNVKVLGVKVVPGLKGVPGVKETGTRKLASHGKPALGNRSAYGNRSWEIDPGPGGRGYPGCLGLKRNERSSED